MENDQTGKLLASLLKNAVAIHFCDPEDAEWDFVHLWFAKPEDFERINTLFNQLEIHGRQCSRTEQLDNGQKVTFQGYDIQDESSVKIFLEKCLPVIALEQQTTVNPTFASDSSEAKDYQEKTGLVMEKLVSLYEEKKLDSSFLC